VPYTIYSHNWPMISNHSPIAAEATQCDPRGPTDSLQKAICYLTDTTDHEWSEEFQTIQTTIPARVCKKRLCVYCGAVQYYDNDPQNPKWRFYHYKFEECKDYPGTCG